MQLQLQAHRQVIRHHPVRQVPGAQIVMARRQQYFAGPLVESVLDQLGHGPVVIFPGTDHELDLIVGRQQFDILVTVAVRFLGTWSLQVHNATDTRVDGRDIQGAAGFQGNLISGITQLLEQGNGVGLRQWLAARDLSLIHI